MSENPIALQNAIKPVPGKKYYTLAEAIRALPLVKRIAADVQATQGQRLRIHAELSSGGDKMTPSVKELLQEEFERESTRLDALNAELAAMGIELKDPSRGLLDFPAVHNGREILLCWKADEATITTWHELDAGFAGRKPVSLLAE